MRRTNLFEIVAAAMMLSGGGTMPMPRGFKTREIKINTFPTTKHTGEVPKGCQKVPYELYFKKGGRHFIVKVELVFGTLKARDKAANKIAHQIGAWMNENSFETIIANPELKEINPPKNNQDEKNESN